MTMQLLSAFFLGVTVTVLVVALLTRYARTKFDVVEKEDDDRRDHNRDSKGRGLG